MMKVLLVILIVALLVTAQADTLANKPARFGSQSNANRAKRCQDVVARYRRFLKAKKLCKRVSECASFQYQCIRQTTTKICLGYKYNYSQRRDVCLAYRSQTSCAEFGKVCQKLVTKRICARVFRRRRVIGPKSCKRGYKLKFAKGYNLIRFCTRVRNVTRRPQTKRQLQTCTSSYDPLIVTFQRQSYTLSSEGDYEMYGSADGSVEVHTRQKILQNSPQTVNKKLAIVLNGVDLIRFSCSTGRLSVNNRKAALKTQQFRNGGSVTVNYGNFLEFFAPNGDKIAVRRIGSQRNCWLNVYVYTSNSRRARGLCFAQVQQAEEHRVAGLFKNFYFPRETTNAITKQQEQLLAKKSTAERNSAKYVCNLKGLAARLKAQCEKDWLLATPARRGIVIDGYKKLTVDAVKARVAKSNFF